MDFATPDLFDAHPDLDSCDVQFRQFGGRLRFSGTAVTITCREDNALVKATLAEPGRGRVLVVDGGGSLRTALMGDLVAATAAGNGWAGVVINGAVRDSVALAGLDLGVKALGTNPRRSAKTGAGVRDADVSFGGVTISPGAQVFSDEDGLLVSVGTAS